MKWRGKRACFHFAAAALGIEENEPVEEFDFAGGTNAAVEIIEIRTATEGHMLTIVDVFAVRQNVGSGAAAKEGTLLE